MGASSSPAMFLVMAPVTKTFTTPCWRGAFVDERDGAGIVNGRRRVGHADDRGEAAARGGGGAGGDVFLCRLARLAQMDVQINQAGTNDFSFRVESFDFLRRPGGSIFADGGDFPVEDEQIGNGVEAIGGVNDPPAGQKQRVHARRAYTRQIDKASAGIMIGSCRCGLAAPKRSAGGRSSMVERKPSNPIRAFLTESNFP